MRSWGWGCAGLAGSQCPGVSISFPLVGHDTGPSQADWDAGPSTAAPQGSGRREGLGRGFRDPRRGRGISEQAASEVRAAGPGARSLTQASLATSVCGGLGCGRDPLARREDFTGGTRGLCLAWPGCPRTVGPRRGLWPYRHRVCSEGGDPHLVGGSPAALRYRWGFLLVTRHPARGHVSSRSTAGAPSTLLGDPHRG